MECINRAYTPGPKFFLHELRWSVFDTKVEIRKIVL
jgi:hypothetical protein